MSRYSAESFRRVSFPIAMSGEQAGQCEDAHCYVSERYAAVLAALPDDAKQPPSFAEVCPDAEADIGREKSALAQAIYARWSEIPIKGSGGLDPSELCALELETDVSGEFARVFVGNADGEDWVNIAVVTKLAQALQEHLGLAEIRFQWGEFSPHDPHNEFGGGVVRIVPGQEPQVFSTGDYLQDPSSAIEAMAEDAASGKTYKAVEKNFLQAMEWQQERNRFDLADEDFRSELVEKAAYEGVVMTPLHATMTETAERWGQEQAKTRVAAQRTAASEPGVGMA